MDISAEGGQHRMENWRWMGEEGAHTRWGPTQVIEPEQQDEGIPAETQPGIESRNGCSGRLLTCRAIDQIYNILRIMGATVTKGNYKYGGGEN